MATIYLPVTKIMPVRQGRAWSCAFLDKTVNVEGPPMGMGDRSPHDGNITKM
ncbi:MAG: hypothetical protein Q8J70_00710 [Thiobacillus sp.]|nr:hypothetical protein [Thiobacillus sp.]